MTPSYVLQRCCVVNSNMDSESSYTYRDLVQEYSLTEDSTQWSAMYINDLQINGLHYVQKLPIVLRDVGQCNSNEEVHISEIKFNDMEEMIFEPLLHLPNGCRRILEDTVASPRSSLYVSISEYGTKHIVFKFHGCLIAAGPQGYALYIPRRFFKKLILDCKSRDVDCKFETHDKTGLYYPVDTRLDLSTIWDAISSKNSPKRVDSDRSSVYGDGFTEYCHCHATICIYLSPDRHSIELEDSNDIVVHTGKRNINIFPFNISL